MLHVQKRRKTVGKGYVYWQVPNVSLQKTPGLNVVTEIKTKRFIQFPSPAKLESPDRYKRDLRQAKLIVEVEVRQSTYSLVFLNVLWAFCTKEETWAKTQCTERLSLCYVSKKMAPISEPRWFRSYLTFYSRWWLSGSHQRRGTKLIRGYFCGELDCSPRTPFVITKSYR